MHAELAQIRKLYESAIPSDAGVNRQYKVRVPDEISDEYSFILFQQVEGLKYAGETSDHKETPSSLCEWASHAFRVLILGTSIILTPPN